MLQVDPLSGFKYKYSLIVDGKTFEQFKENQSKAMKTWETVVNSNPYRIVLEKNTLDIFINGKLVDENVMDTSVQNFGCSTTYSYLFIG